MNTKEHDLAEPAKGGVSVYCLASIVAEQAKQNGFAPFANALENALESLLSGLPRDEQKQALRLSFDIATAGLSTSAPKLKLVYSRP
ncbi:hypothetical protein [Aestuariivirga sp.]|uniref:hypothetical protein n=1 Tax=Aestuariivirga sp. TaxID=2650926 RepID=UPI0039E2D987